MERVEHHFTCFLLTDRIFRVITFYNSWILSYFEHHMFSLFHSSKIILLINEFISEIMNNFSTNSIKSRVIWLIQLLFSQSNVILDNKKYGHNSITLSRRIKGLKDFLVHSNYVFVCSNELMDIHWFLQLILDR